MLEIANVSVNMLPSIIKIFGNCSYNGTTVVIHENNIHPYFIEEIELEEEIDIMLYDGSWCKIKK